MENNIREKYENLLKEAKILEEKIANEDCNYFKLGLYQEISQVFEEICEIENNYDF